MSCARSRSMRCPSNQISPPLTGSIPLIDRAVVVLPAPLTPSRATTSPAATSNDTSCSARNAPYRAAMPLTSSSVPDLPRGLPLPCRTCSPPEVPRYTAATC